MILILSHIKDGHVLLMLPALEAAGASVFWFRTNEFPTLASLSLAFDEAGHQRRTLQTRDGMLDLDRVTAVWYRRPRTPDVDDAIEDRGLRRYVADESWRVISGLFETLDCRWVPGKPSRENPASNKVNEMARAAALGFRLPRSLHTNAPQALLDFYEECGGRIVTKSLNGTMDTDGGARYPFTYLVRRRDLARIRAVRFAPVLAQEYVEKDVELRITVIGDDVFPAEIHSQVTTRTRVDWRHYDDETPYGVHDLPEDVAARCVRLVRELGLTYGSIDLIRTPTGEYVFLEINPNGQWAWIETATGLPIRDALVAHLMHGATERERSA
ncbi:MAG: MvdC/MvdD family ATP grasp protein [Gemmatimonadales bacterium]